MVREPALNRLFLCHDLKKKERYEMRSGLQNQTKLDVRLRQSLRMPQNEIKKIMLRNENIEEGFMIE